MAKAKDAPTDGGKHYEVRLKPGHPTGVYHRAGLTFSRGEPTLLTEVSEAIKNDGWLIVTEVAAENAQN